MADLVPLRALRLQLEMERIDLDAAGRLYRLPGGNPDDIALVYAARLASGECVVYVRKDVAPPLAAQVRALPPRQVFEDTSGTSRPLYGPQAAARAGLVQRFRTGHFAQVDGAFEPRG